jgi:hypothetical protein
MPRPKPDPNEFAKNVLWHLCNLRAEISTLKGQLDEIRKSVVLTPDQAKALTELEAVEESKHQALYRDACLYSRLSPGPPGTRHDYED